MKVALVTYALNIGGMESFLFGLARRLRNFGMESTFVVTESYGAWHEYPLAEGFGVISVLPRKWQSSRRHARMVASALRDFDAVILNHSSAAQSAAGLLPDSTVVISVLHNNMDDIFRTGLANPGNIDCFVAVSEQVREQALKWGALPGKVSCIRNGVEVFSDYPKNDDMPSPEGPLKVVYLGRIEHQQKGVFYLPGIIAGVRNCGADASFDVIGNGTDYSELLARTEKLNLSGIVTFHGALSHSEAMRMVGEADVLIMPSHFEGQPITLFEAMARGVVPLASRLPGITDTVICEGRDGLLAPIGDEGAFVDRLVSLAADRGRVRMMSRAAWQSALERFGIDTMTRRYVVLLEKCLKERRTGSACRKSGRLYLPLLGKRSQFPLFLHDAMRNCKRLTCAGRTGGKGARDGN
jgi:glycosyltransferase involved in cell wall biosynthesis